MNLTTDTLLAERYCDEGKRLDDEGNLKESIQQYEKAAQLYQKWELWEKYLEAKSEIGYKYIFLGQFEKVNLLLQKILELASQKLSKNHPIFAHIYNSLGLAASYQDKHKEALEHHHKALKIYHIKGKRTIEIANTYAYIGVCYERMMISDKAISYIHKALEIQLDLLGHSHSEIAVTYGDLASAYMNKEDFDKALSYHQKALDIFLKSSHDHPHNLAALYTNMGTCYRVKGDYSQALQYFYKALNLNLKVWGEAHTETAICGYQIGICLEGKGEILQSIPYFQKSLTTLQKIYGEVHYYVAGGYHNLGRSYRKLRDFDQAIECFQKTLEIHLQLFEETHPQIANSYNSIAVTYRQSGNLRQALSFYHKSQKIYEQYGKKSNQQANVYKNIGEIHFKKGEYKLALLFSQKALRLLIQDYDNEDIYHSPVLEKYTASLNLLNTLHQKALIFYHLYKKTHQTKDLQASCNQYQLSLQLIAQMRQSYKAEGSKLFLAKNSFEVFDQSIQVSLKLSTLLNSFKEKEMAFITSEQSKAYLLLSNLKENDAKTTAHIPKELIEKEKQLKVELNFLSKSIAKQEAKNNEEPENQELLLKFQSDYFDHKQQYDQLITQFEQDYPAYYQLKYSVEMANVEQIQAYLQQGHNTGLNQKAALISYFVGEKTIYIFTFTDSLFEVQEISKPLHFSDLIEDLQSALQLIDLEDFVKAARELYQLLIWPIEAQIEDIQKLVILRHDILEYIPFEVLLTHDLSPTSNPTYANLPYLLQDFEICYHYSATLLLNGIAKNQITKTLPNTFLGFAPVTFNGEKPIELALESKRGQNKILRSNQAGEQALQQLPNTETEVKEVYQLFQDKKLDAKAFLYGSASKENLMEEVSKHKFILISTHGFVEDEEAGLSGICLAGIRNQKQNSLTHSLFRDFEELNTEKNIKDGESEFRNQWTNTQTQLLSQTHKHLNTNENYLLYTSDAYHLQLNADLVVLSSCSSGIGKFQKGEGMMAMNRGFLYAGASNIVFTQFDIPDHSSSLLVKKMFEYILEGVPYSTALQRTKLEMIQIKGNSPQDWAGFVLIGG